MKIKNQLSYFNLLLLGMFKTSLLSIFRTYTLVNVLNYCAFIISSDLHFESELVNTML